MEKQRHSLSHLLAIAVLEFDPNAKLAIGPVIENGFYYDFLFSQDKIPNESDLKNFQKRIKKMIGQKLDFVSEEISEDKAKELFSSQPFKLELISEIIQRGEKISVYKTQKNGEDIFVDLCSGPHVLNTQEINPDAFVIEKMAGAYWRGDEKREMLTRLYGLAFSNKEELDTYKKQQEEAKNRDHRKIGKELDLFTFSDLVGSGLPLFTPRGTIMRDAIINRINKIQEKFGFQKVWIPHITKPDLYKTSGHWDKFADELFKIKSRESEFVMKPMNCPHHTQIYASSPKSYRDLPVRYVEATTVYRDEQSGELLGLSRVRSLTQDDGHVFCTKDQVPQEIKNIIQVMKEFYTDLDLWNENSMKVMISARDPQNKDKYLGDDSIWNESENLLKEIAESERFNYQVAEGEAAFYGPKIDFKFRDALGREWQLATVQLDFNMPQRFGLEYTDKDGHKKTPVMIHRAIAGSIERFLSVIIEHYNGNFPVWLAPEQARLIPINENHFDFLKKLELELRKNRARTHLDLSNDALSKKIKNAKKNKVPYMIVVGDKEISENKLNIETNTGKKKILSVEDFIELIKKEI